VGERDKCDECIFIHTKQITKKCVALTPEYMGSHRCVCACRRERCREREKERESVCVLDFLLFLPYVLLWGGYDE